MSEQTFQKSMQTYIIQVYLTHTHTHTHTYIYIYRERESSYVYINTYTQTHGHVFMLRCVRFYADSSVHGTFWARMLEWVAISYSGNSVFPEAYILKRDSQLRDQTRVSYVSSIGRQILYHCTNWEVLYIHTYIYVYICTCICTYICIYIYLLYYVHTHTHIYLCICIGKQQQTQIHTHIPLISVHQKGHRDISSLTCSSRMMAFFPFKK